MEQRISFQVTVHQILAGLCPFENFGESICATAYYFPPAVDTSACRALVCLFYFVFFFFFFCIRIYCVGTQWNHLAEAIPVSTHINVWRKNNKIKQKSQVITSGIWSYIEKVPFCLSYSNFSLICWQQVRVNSHIAMQVKYQTCT